MQRRKEVENEIVNSLEFAEQEDLQLMQMKTDDIE
jgi:hypothetical protein